MDLNEYVDKLYWYAEVFNGIGRETFLLESIDINIDEIFQYRGAYLLKNNGKYFIEIACRDGESGVDQTFLDNPLLVGVEPDLSDPAYTYYTFRPPEEVIEIADKLEWNGFEFYLSDGWTAQIAT